MPNSSKPARKRAAGRRSGLDSGDLQGQVLDAAELCFGEDGFAATPIRRVAECAGVNPALVHYYFGTKRQLLVAVMDRVFLPLAKAVAELNQDPDVAIDRLTDLLFDTFDEHPALPRLIVREVMLTSGELREHFVLAYAPRLGGALPPILARAQASGRINPGLDPAVLALNILGLCLFPFIARTVAEPALGIRYDRAGLAQVRAQVRQLVKSGVSP